jgi:hypothetical protein
MEWNRLLHIEKERSIMATENARFATRFLLFGEFILGWLSMAWAISALIGTGDWWRALNAGGSITWAWGLLTIGVAQWVVAASEFFEGRAWNDERLHAFCETRHILAVLATIGWFALMYKFILSNSIVTAPAIYLQAAMIVGGNIVVLVNNKRLSVLLDPSIPTDQLRARLIDARARGKGVL